MLLVGFLPLVVGLSIAFYLGMHEIQEVNGANFQALAVETARRVDLTLIEEQTKNLRITKIPQIFKTLEENRDRLTNQDPGVVQEMIRKEQEAWMIQGSHLKKLVGENGLSEILTRNVLENNMGIGSPTSMVARSATRALFLTDIFGRTIATTNTHIDYLHAQAPWWKGAFHQGVGKPYVSDLVYDETLKSYSFSISLPVMDSIQYQAVGVLHRVYDAKEFFGPSIDLIRFGKTGHVMLIDSQGVVLSCPILPTGIRIADTQLIPLVTPPESGWVLGPSDGHGGQEESIIGFASPPTITRITRDSTGNAWHLFVWQSSQELFAPVYNLRTWIATFGVLACLLLIILGILVSRRVVQPIRNLQQAAKLIANRELTEPIAIHTGDEIEELAEEFNRMNVQLQAAFSGLITEVETKTEEVEYLRESTSQVLEGIPDPVLIVTQDLRIQYMNLAAKQAIGLELVSGEKRELCELLAPSKSDRDVLLQEIQFHLPPRQAIVSPNGVNPKRTKPMNDPLIHPLESSQPQDEKILTINKRLFRYDCFPILARSGEPPSVGLVLRDATEEKLLQDELINSEKSTSLGMLCTGIGHELNNPLVGVIGMGEAIQEEDDIRKVKEHAKSIVQQGKRMAQVIRDLTGQVRNQAKGEYLPLDLNEQLDLILTYMNLPENFPKIILQKSYQDLQPFQGQAEEVRLVFFHVMKNAIQAMGEKGELTIHTQSLDSTHIEVLISDSGTGIPASLLPRIFDPFVTTKSQGEGNGLGLTIAKRIMTKYGGRIDIHSQEEDGTQCTLTFSVPNDVPDAKDSTSLQHTSLTN